MATIAAILKFFKSHLLPNGKSDFTSLYFYKPSLDFIDMWFVSLLEGYKSVDIILLLLLLLTTGQSHTVRIYICIKVLHSVFSLLYIFEVFT